MKKQTTNHSIQNAFVLLLMGMFAVLSVILVLLGTRAYQSEVARSKSGNQLRIAQNYVRGVIRSEQTQDSIQVEMQDSLPVLTIRFSDNTGTPELYCRRLYCSDGYLMESYVSADYAFRASDGEPICKMEAFEPTIENDLLVIRMKDASGEESTIQVALRCSAKGQ